MKLCFVRYEISRKLEIKESQKPNSLFKKAKKPVDLKKYWASLEDSVLMRPHVSFIV